jgi:hypothetical protein
MLERPSVVIKALQGNNKEGELKNKNAMTLLGQVTCPFLSKGEHEQSLSC